MGTSVIKRHKSWGKIPVLGSNLKFRGQNSDIYHLSFWRQNLGLQQEFQRQILGPSPPDLLIWKYPPGVFVWEYMKTGKSILRPAFKQSNRKTASSPFILIERHLIKRTIYVNSIIVHMQQNHRPVQYTNLQRNLQSNMLMEFTYAHYPKEPIDKL